MKKTKNKTKQRLNKNTKAKITILEESKDLGQKLDFEVKLFFKKSFYFLLIFIFFTLLFNSIYYNSIASKKIIARTEQIYQDHISKMQDRKIEYAFFGDSHAQAAINPAFINDSYNFATGAENYFKTYYKLKKITEKDNVKLDYVFLETDLHSFSSWGVDQYRLIDEYWFYSKFIPYSEINKVTKKSYLEIFVKSNLPFLGKGQEIFMGKDLSPIYLGWLNNSGDFSKKDRQRTALVRYNEHFNHRERISNISMEYFKKTLELARDKKIKIVLIKYPISKDLYDMVIQNNISNEAYYLQVFSQVNLVTKDYIVLDYQDMFFSHPEYFADSDHLNEIGARIVSERIYSDLNSKLSAND